MIVCEYVLTGTITVSIVTISALVFAHYHTMSNLVSQIKKLENKVHDLHEKLVSIQMKVLDLNEISGLNENI